LNEKRENAREQNVTSNGASRRCWMMKKKLAKSGTRRLLKRQRGSESNMVLLVWVACPLLHLDHNLSSS
jgi:hypothetical protein